MQNRPSLKYWRLINKAKWKALRKASTADQQATDAGTLQPEFLLRSWGQARAKQLLDSHPWQVNYSERLFWTSWLLYQHIFASFLLILIVAHFTALPHDLLSPELLLSTAWFDRFSQFCSHYYSTHIPPPPVFLYFTHVQRHTGSFKGIQHQAVHLIGDCLVPFAIIAFQMYRFFIYCSGLHSLLDANITWLIIQSTVPENNWFPWTLPQISLISLL